MLTTVQAPVLVVGAGPVGLTLALDLAWRGIDVIVVETRLCGEPPPAKCNHVSARTMEIYRRLGIAGEIRNAGLPGDYPNDVSFRTTFTVIQLARIPIPCRNDRYSATDGPDTGWPTPEPPPRINRTAQSHILWFGWCRWPPSRLGIRMGCTWATANKSVYSVGKPISKCGARL